MRTDRKKAAQASDLIKEIVVMFVSALFVIFWASPISAQSLNIKGRVVAIDNAAKILTLNPAGTNDQHAFHPSWSTAPMDKNTNTLNNINVGDEVTIRYYQKSNGEYVAEGITLLPLPPGMHKGYPGV